MIILRNILFIVFFAFCSVAHANQRLLGKKAIVTGANRGIGKAIAVGFSKEGAEVVIGYCTDKEAALATLEEISALGVKATAIQVDMSHSESVAQFFLESIKFLGDVDILVNNAGIVSFSPFLEATESDLDHVMDVNLKGPFLLLQHFAKYLKSLGHGGSAINVSSISANMSVPNLAAYQCSKAALSMLTKGAALELASIGIRVNTLAPGLIATDLNRFLWEGDAAGWEQLSKAIPLGRTGLPEDQMGAAIFLASDESSWMTGSSLTVDGGAERR
jgi:NAD(P)-dependent dehydrogenase (short-subunit alcohol dehydrogenase family)